MSDYSDHTLSLADHLAAALKPIDRKDVALALADLFGSRVTSGEKSVIAMRLLNGTAIDNMLAEIRDLLDGTTAVGEVAALSLPSVEHVHDYSEVCTRACPASPWHDEDDTASLPPAKATT